jgi:type IV pilus assembly protein PilO
MKLRGRELYIIAGVVAVVVVVAWYFFFMKSVRSDLKTADSSYVAAQAELSSAQQYIARLEQDKKAATATHSDLVRLNKMIPAETEQPSLIVELNQSARAAGLLWDGWTSSPTTAMSPFSIQSVELIYYGRYFDIEDFLYRVENYVQYRHGAFLVSGRMFAVTGMAMKTTAEDAPVIQLTVTIAGYIWTPAGSSAAAKAAVPGGN